MINEKYAVYEKEPAHGSLRNGMILGPFDTKEEAHLLGKKYGYLNSNNYYVGNVNTEKVEQIIDDAYGNYITYIHDVVQEQYQIYGDWYGKEEFIDKCKTDPEFSEKWGLKIVERYLDKNQGWERYDLMIEKTSEKELKEKYKNDASSIWIGFKKFRLEDANYLCDLEKFPTKLITLTYNNETIEVYE